MIENILAVAASFLLTVLSKHK